MKNFAAIIFDMDGVVVDSEPLHNKAWATLFAELGHGDTHGLDFNNYIGVTDRILVRDFLAATKLPVTYDELRPRKYNHLVRYLREHRPVFDELHSLLPDLHQRYQLALATNSSHRLINVVMEISDLRDHFDVIISGEDIQNIKPDPEIYLTAAARLGVNPADCCAIEDSPTGITAAKAAGMTAIGFTSGLPAEKLAGADHIAHNYADVRRLLL